jgi:hypothetical protein
MEYRDGRFSKDHSKEEFRSRDKGNVRKSERIGRKSGMDQKLKPEI